MMAICDISYTISLTSITFCKYQLVVDGKKMLLTFPQLLQLREKINVLTSYQNIIEIIEKDNFVLLFVADKQHLLYLEIPQLIDLKDEIALFFQDFKSVSF